MDDLKIEEDPDHLVYVVSGTGIRHGRYHTDADCRHLKQSTKFFTKDIQKNSDAISHLQQCQECAQMESQPVQTTLDAKSG